MMGIARSKIGVANKNRRVSSSIPSQFPSHFRDSDSLLIPFIEAYYEWLEEAGSALNDTYRLLDYRDIDKTDLARFEQYFRDEFLPSFPPEILADKALLIKHVKTFYRSRGSEKSFKFLFRILFDEDIEIEYPQDFILRTSDGVWVKKRYIKIDAFDDGVANFAGRKMYGTISTASAIVESVTIVQTLNYKYAQLEVSSILGVFANDEPVETRDDNGKIYGRILGQVSSYVISNPGTGYTTGQILTLDDPADGSGFVARISAVGFNGEIRSIAIVDRGVGYTYAPTVDLEQGGTGAVVTFNVSSTYYSPGEYIGTRGQLSSTCRLQDGKYYQDYSYVIKSNLPLSKYKDIVKRLVHPAGMGLFSEQTNEANPDIFGDALKILFHLSHPEDENYKDPRFASSRKFWDPEIQKESYFTKVSDLIKEFPDTPLADIFWIYFNYYRFWATVKPALQRSNFYIDRTGKCFIARSEADTFIALYETRIVEEFQNMIIGDIEPYTGYPNPKLTFIEIIT